MNAVCPAPIETRMMRSLEEAVSPGNQEAAHIQFNARIPMGRYGEPDEVAALVAFLCSDDASSISLAVSTRLTAGRSPKLNDVSVDCVAAPYRPDTVGRVPGADLDGNPRDTPLRSAHRGQSASAGRVTRGTLGAGASLRLEEDGELLLLKLFVRLA